MRPPRTIALLVGAGGAERCAVLTAAALMLSGCELKDRGDNELNGKALCDQIRLLLKNQPGTVCFFHDGLGMVNARIG